MPKLILWATIFLSVWRSDGAAAFSDWNSKNSELDIEEYLCTTNQPGLTTVAQATEWFAYLASGRASEVTASGRNGQACTGTMQRMVRDGIWNADGPASLSQIIALAGFLETPPADPEQRLAHDTEMLGWLALACTTFPGEERACIARATRDLSAQTMSESPVFCGVSDRPPLAEFKRIYEPYLTAAAFSICDPLLAPAEAGAAQGENWWSRVSMSLSPMLADEGGPK